MSFLEPSEIDKEMIEAANSPVFQAVNKVIEYTENTDKQLRPGGFDKKADKELPEYWDFLKEKYEVDTKEEVVDTMRALRIFPWTKMDEETGNSYSNFLIFLQLPVMLRNYKNVTLVRRQLNGLDVSEYNEEPLDIWSYVSKEQKFWHSRAKLYDLRTSEALIASLQDDQKQQIALMRSRSLSMASMAGEAAIQYLGLAVDKLSSISADEIRVQDLPQILRLIMQVAESSNQLGSEALLLDDMLTLMTNYEATEDERIIDAKKV